VTNKYELRLDQLTTCGIAGQGNSIELHATEQSGVPMSLEMSFENAQAVMMTLPRLLTKALRQRTGDPNLRYVFPLGEWSLERSSDNEFLIMTLKTGDGFDVSFAVPLAASRSLGASLKQEVATIEKSFAAAAAERLGNVLKFN